MPGKKPKRRASSAASTIDRARLRELATPIMKIVSSLVVVACLGRAAAHLAEQGRAEPRFLVDPSATVDDAVPDWVPDAVVDELRSRLAVLPPVSIFDEDFPSRVAAAIEGASPWIDEVRRVERIYPNRALIDMDLHKPVASVDLDGTRYLLDAEARVLHVESAYQPSSFPFRVMPVVGADPSYTPGLGGRFPDPEVLNAVSVALELNGLPPAYRAIVEEVRPVALLVREAAAVRGAHAAQVCVRSAQSSAVIRWGRPQTFRTDDGEVRAWGLMEPPPEKKVTHLATILSAYPGLRALEEARLDFDRPWVREVGGGVEQLESDWIEAPDAGPSSGS